MTEPTLPPIDSLTGRHIGAFVVGRRLSEGGMGTVYLAEHQTIGMKAAVKFLRPEVADSADGSTRFLTEARALAALNNRNLVKVSDFGATSDGLQYLVMEFIEGSTLERYLLEQRQRGRMPLPPAQALQFADQILNGLGEAHKKGIVHRDLKPANIMKGSEHGGQVVLKIVDFGLASEAPVRLSGEARSQSAQSSLLAGTPEFIAPEQAQGLRGDGRADLYALGVMLYQMLSGRLPFVSESVLELVRLHSFARPPPLSSLDRSLPDGVCELVHSLLEKDPNKRPATADVARQAVQRLLKSIERDATSIKAMPLAPAETPTLLPMAAAANTTAELIARVNPRRWQRSAFAVGLLLLFLAGAAWLLWREPPREVAVVPRPVEAAPVEVMVPAEVQRPVEALPPAPVDASSDPDLAALVRKPPVRLPKPEVRPLVAVAPPGIETFPRCADLGQWRVEEVTRSDEIDARVRQRLLAEKIENSKIDQTMATLRAVRQQISRASTGEQCAAASLSLNEWAEAHGL